VSISLFFDLETTGLDPARDKIITIQVRDHGRNKIWRSWESDEFSIIEAFLDFLKNVDNDEPIFGYNILKFDVPFLLSRIANYRTRVGISRSLWRLIYNKRWMDLYQILGDSYLSVREWTARTEFKRKVSYSGKDIPVLYSQRKFRQIVRYINEELRIQESLFDWVKASLFYRQLIELQKATNPEKIKRLLLAEPTAKVR
jgi:uncharacterized protein YprB with RNaseH-like and TPR domain